MPRRPPAGLVAALAVVLLVGTSCAGDDTAEPPTTVASTGTASITPASAPLAPAPPAGSAPGPVPAPATTPAPPATADPDAEPAVGTEPVAALDTPVDLAVRPGDSSAYMVEQPGRVVAVDLATGATRQVLDISDLTEASGERGLLGLAFHPSEPFAYVNYTTAGAGDTVIAEYAVAGDGTFDAASARTVLAVDQPYSNHNGGDLEFGPDGYLYIALGDGGSGNDPERRADDTTDLLGKLLRIDPRGGDPYAVPPDNPFASGGAGAPEVWAWGLRNPWKFAFDAPTGDLWIADVGQNAMEEVDRVSATDGRTAGYAANFGWSAFEGTRRVNDDVPDPGDLVAPVLTYGHDQGCSVSGGVVYRGAAVPDLAGWYVYSDYCSGTLWAFDPSTGRNIVLAEGLSAVTGVRTGPDGEAYVIERTGNVLRLVAG